MMETCGVVLYGRIGGYVLVHWFSWQRAWLDHVLCDDRSREKFGVYVGSCGSRHCRGGQFGGCLKDTNKFKVCRRCNWGDNL